MPKSFDLGDYVDVDARLAWFFDRYPQGSMVSEVTHLTAEYVVVKAYAYRSETDSCPGVGHAMEPIPGRTPYTKDSELMNAETSAWGRALAAIGAPTKGSVASKQEVAARREHGPHAGSDAPAAACTHSNTASEERDGATVMVCLDCGAERIVKKRSYADKENPWGT